MLILVGTLLSSFSMADVLPVSSSTSSSWFMDGDDTYEDKNLYDGTVGKAWVENDTSSGLGSWVELKLEAEQKVEEVRILPGNWYSFNEWDYYNRPAEIEIAFSDGTKETVKLSDAKIMVAHKLSKPVKTSSVRLTVKKIHSGSAYTDRTAISEVQVIGKGIGTKLVASSITGSSVSKENNDGNYLGANIQDGLRDTAWCTPKGSGESVTLKYDSLHDFSSLELVNSNAIDLKISMSYSRPKTLSLKFDDGEETVTVKPFMTLQKVTFPKHTSQSVTITMGEVMAGKQFTDACISELYLK